MTFIATVFSVDSEKLDSYEGQIRDALVKHLRSVNDESTAYLTELFVGNFSRRADLVVANGILSAYEIKSASDRLDRLAGQLSSYKKHFEGVTVVCAVKHLPQIKRIAPRGVGILTVSERGDISAIRSATRLKPRKDILLSFLPVIELRKLLQNSGQSIKATAGRAVLLAEARAVDYSSIRDYLLNYMKRKNAINIARRSIAQERSAQMARLREIESKKHVEMLKFSSQMNAMKAIPRLVLPKVSKTP